MPLISVIIPCYNAEQYLVKCIASVYCQDLQESDFELIIINDGSTDQSEFIAKEITKNKSNVKMISQPNKGLGGARNTGILNAAGEYLLFLDADDWLLPNVLRKVVDIAQKNQLDILEFSAQGINAAGKIVYHFKNQSEVFISGFEYYNKVRYMNSACNKLYKRNFIRKNKILFLEGIYIEDFEFNTRCLISAKKIKATDTLVAQFLQTENSITRNRDEVKKRKMIADIVQVIKITDHQYKCQSNSHENRFYLERLNFLVASLFFQLVKNKVSYKEMRALQLKLKEEQVLYINHRIFESKKNLFRIILLKNLWLYQLIIFFK